MRQDTYCSFEVSKILKEKGFDAQCRAVYTDYGKLFTIQIQQYVTNIVCSKGNLWECIAPTHQMAMQWLRDEHDILITVLPDKTHNIIALFWNVYIVTEKEYKWIFAGGGVNMTYEELIEEALLYSLKTLIN